MAHLSSWNSIRRHSWDPVQKVLSLSNPNYYYEIITHIWLKQKKKNQIIIQIIDMSIFKLLHLIVIYDIHNFKKVSILLVVGYIINKTTGFGMTVTVQPNNFL